MELYQLRYFNTLCKFHSIDRAAESLFISRSTLISALKRLEQEVGSPLRRRSGTTYELTEVGQKLFDTSERVIAELDGLNSSFESDMISNTFIRFGIGLELCSPAFLRELFSFQHTQEYAFRISRMRGSRVREHVTSGKTTLGMVIAQPTENATLNIYTIKRVEYGLYTHSSHSSSNEDVIRLSDLAGRKLPILNFTGDLRAPLSVYFSKYRIMISSSDFTNPFYGSAVKYVSRDMGSAIFPIDEEVPTGVSVSRFDPPLVLRHVAISRRDAASNRMSQSFMEHLQSIDMKGGVTQ